MVFTVGQMLGIGLFTAAVLVIGMLLLKLESMIGIGCEPGEDEASTADVASSSSFAATPKRATSRRRRRH